jgi:uncharacterized delta-60 repeat protein
MKQLSFRLAIVFALFLPFLGSAQDGSNDATFNPSDRGYAFGNGANGGIPATVIQSDGKIVLGGGFWNWDSTNSHGLVRLNPSNGLPDTSFHVGTGADNGITTMALQANGQFIIGGLFLKYNGKPVERVARLNANGTLDATFNTAAGANNLVNTVAVQTDGKVLIGGTFWLYGSTTVNYLARLTTLGAIDTSFHTGTGASGAVDAIVIQPDGKILVGGEYAAMNGVGTPFLTRLNTNGTTDTSFHLGTGPDSYVYTVALQSDNKILISGLFTNFNGTPANYLARLHPNGSLDTTFKVGTGAQVKTFTELSGGKLLIGGGFKTYNSIPVNSLARLNSNGSLDVAFNPGIGVDGYIQSTAIQNDGKIIIVGSFIYYNTVGRTSAARVNTDGSPDVTFNPGNACSGTVYSISRQTDGKIVLGGWFSQYFDAPRGGVVRINLNGSIDTTFNPGTGAGTVNVLATAIQSNRKILIGGDFTSYNGVSINRLARLNTDGSLDPSFHIGTGANDRICTISIQSDGKIIVGGYFLNFNGANAYLTRLNTDGSTDATFHNGTLGPNNAVQASAIQTDGKIIIGGYLTTYNSITSNNMARLNTDGTLDATFNMGTAANQSLSACFIQTDGKILIGGSFTTYNGAPAKYLARLNTDGTLDPTFNIGTGPNNGVLSINEQTDGKLVIGGAFTSFNGTTSNYLTRLTPTGSLDPSFLLGKGADSWVQAICMQADGKILIGGSFHAYNGTGRNCIARINNPSITGFEENSLLSGIHIYPNPTSGVVMIDAKPNQVYNIIVTNTLGQVISSQNAVTTPLTWDAAEYPSGIYFIRIQSGKQIQTGKLVVRP